MKNSGPYVLPAARLQRHSTLADQEVQGRFTDLVKPGDRITIINRFGQQRSGRVVMLNFKQDCAVLNMGGAHGTPGLADFENTIRVKRGKNIII